MFRILVTSGLPAVRPPAATSVRRALRRPLIWVLIGSSMLAACSTPPTPRTSSSASPVGAIAMPRGQSAPSFEPGAGRTAAAPRHADGGPGGGAAVGSQAPARANDGGPDFGGDLSDLALRERISLAFARRGWRPVGIAPPVGAEGEPDFVLAQTEQAVTTDERVTVWLLHLFSRAQAQTFGHAAMMTQVQIDCAARTMRALKVETYRDRTARERTGQRDGADTVLRIRGGTESDVLALNLCGPMMSTGSGVIVAARTVLTNAHVVQHCSRVETLVDGRRLASEVRAVDASTDLALVGLPNLAGRAMRPGEPLRLRRSATIGEPILAAGYPLSGLLGRDIVVTTGIVNALAGLNADSTRLQISAPVQPGNSGGPLLDKSGQLVGVVTSRLNALVLAAQTGTLTENVNFAIKPELLKLFLDGNRVSMPQTDVGPPLAPEALALRGAAVTVKLECSHRGRPEDSVMGVSRRLKA